MSSLRVQKLESLLDRVRSRVRGDVQVAAPVVAAPVSAEPDSVEVITDFSDDLDGETQVRASVSQTVTPAPAAAAAPPPASTTQHAVPAARPPVVTIDEGDDLSVSVEFGSPTAPPTSRAASTSKSAVATPEVKREAPKSAVAAAPVAAAPISPVITKADLSSVSASASVTGSVPEPTPKTFGAIIDATLGL